MSDTMFVAAAYLVGLGALAAYAAGLARRLRAARSTHAAMERRAAARDTGAAPRTPPR
jgi:hypothetical protein